MSSSPIRVRFAPSPTGFLHVGGARTALFNWLWARKNGGTFVLRIEDTDLERSTEESTKQILDSLKWLGLEWDEGPFFQSQRMPIYFEHLERLRASGHVYPAFESKEELDEARRKAEEEKRNPIYDRASLRLSKEEVGQRMASGQPFVWRFKVPDEGYTEFHETLQGSEETRFENSKLGDFIITRPGTLDNPGIPLYNFVCVVDDMLMGITHVIRGNDHFSNTAKQVLMYHAFGHEPPVFTHLPLITKNNKKMSKRDSEADERFPVSVSGRRDVGYLPEATVNFIALLGCSYPMDAEIFPIDQLIANYSLDRLNKSNANFDEDKYLHINATYLRNMDRARVAELVKPFLTRAGFDISLHDDTWLQGIIELEIERCRVLGDFPEALRYFFAAPEAYEEKGVRKVFEKDNAVQHLKAAAELLEKLEPFHKDSMEAALREYGEKHAIGFGKIAQPIRLAVTGRTASPGLFEVLQFLGKAETVRRIGAAVDLLDSGSVPTV